MPFKKHIDKGTAKAQRIGNPITQGQIEALARLTRGLCELYEATNPGIKPGQRLLTLEQASIYMGRSVYSVRGLIWKGDIPFIKADEHSKKQWLDVKDLDKWIAEHKDVMI